MALGVVGLQMMIVRLILADPGRLVILPGSEMI